MKLYDTLKIYHRFLQDVYLNKDIHSLICLSLLYYAFFGLSEEA